MRNTLSEQNPQTAAHAGGMTVERITLSVDPKVLNPLHEKNAAGQLTLTAFYSDGSQRILRPLDAVITVKTKAASGNVEVAAIEGGTVVAREGGIATLEATVTDGGRTLKACADVVVRPYYRDYHQSLVLKLFLGMEGDPVERLAREPMFQKPHDVLCTFEEALEVIRKTDNLTRGIPKIIYLVGWQKGGHDHGYPAWSDVNPRMKRQRDATALDSLRWLIREARQFNTTVSLHINMVDAYKQSPLWEEYVAKDCFARDAAGKLFSGGIQMKGEEMYSVVYPREWEAGLAQRRIDGLIAMIPELKEGHTIHIDVFTAQRDGGKPISEWHAKPENGGLTPDKYVETQRKIFHYWRDRGFDVTGEGTGWAHPAGEHFIGLQAMSWWYSWDQMLIPECLGARGRTDRGGEGDFRFGSSMHGEEIWQRDSTNMPGFLGMFCRTTLPWYYLSRLERQRLESDVLYYSEGVVARNEGGKRIIRKGDFVLRENDNLFVPALWTTMEIIAYSLPGYENKVWHLPDEWSDVRSVDLYRITLDGCVPLKKYVPVVDAKLVLTLESDEAVAIVPAGDTPEGVTAVDIHREREERMRWFTEARFGMFIHWGIYAVPGGEWNGKGGHGEWIQESARIPMSRYTQFAREFNPVQFDAREWVRIARDAGMKYLVITAKHHDGFGMYRSDLTEWCITSTPFQRDPLMELAEACREGGLKFGVYYSIMDWHHTDWPERRAWNDRASGEPDLARYIQFMKGQFKELITRYGPISILWFDGDTEKCWPHQSGVDLYYYLRSLQPDLIINNRIANARTEGWTDEGSGDFGTPEQHIPEAGQGAGLPWEACMTINGFWGYEKNDLNWKSADFIVRSLVDCASKGGNFLLNVGPTAEGVIPLPSVERLAQVGDWMKVNGEAIYGTIAGQVDALPADCLATEKPGRVYLHLFNWPEKIAFTTGSKAVRAFLLADPARQALPLTSTSGKVEITLPKDNPGRIATVVCIEVDNDR